MAYIKGLTKTGASISGQSIALQAGTRVAPDAIRTQLLAAVRGQTALIDVCQS